VPHRALDLCEGDRRTGDCGIAGCSGDIGFEKASAEGLARRPLKPASELAFLGMLGASGSRDLGGVIALAKS